MHNARVRLTIQVDKTLLAVACCCLFIGTDSIVFNTNKARGCRPYCLSSFDQTSLVHTIDRILTANFNSLTSNENDEIK
jgi:hypothetical protein